MRVSRALRQALRLGAVGLFTLVLVACSAPAPGGGGEAKAQTNGSSSSAVGTGGSGSERSSSLPYRADWSSGLNGWTGSKDWSVLGGKLLCGGKEGTLRAGVVAPVDLDSVGDYAVEAEIQLLRYQHINASFGVMVRVQEDGEGYAVGPTDTDQQVVMRPSGSYRELDSQPFTPGAESHIYRVEVRGNELRAFVDGAQVLSTTDNTFLTGKRVGLWSYGAQLSIRSFEVINLAG